MKNRWLEQSMASGPGFLLAWSFSCSKMAIGRQFAINKSISNYVFLYVLKKACVNPINKTDNPLESVSYRPISVTPTIAKIFESHLLKQMSEQVGEHKINKNQIGILKNKSLNGTVISLTVSINQIVEQMTQLLVFS